MDSKDKQWFKSKRRAIIITSTVSSVLLLTAAGLFLMTAFGLL